MYPGYSKPESILYLWTLASSHPYNQSFLGCGSPQTSQSGVSFSFFIVRYNYTSPGLPHDHGSRCPPNTTFTNAQVSGFYFRPCRNEYDEVIPEYFRCIGRETGSVLNFVRHSWNLYGWMHWIIESNLPLSFCEFARQEDTQIGPISEETLRLDMSGVTQAVERRSPRTYQPLWRHVRRGYARVGALRGMQTNGSEYYSKAERHRIGFQGLQGRDVDLLDVRQWFDELIAVKPQYERFLAVETEANQGNEDDNLSFVERLRKRRRLEHQKVTYEHIKTIPPTSNAVERFFSVARVTLGQQRQGLLPATLEMISLFWENRSYWDASTVNCLK
ncbi:hypothetical protein GQ600_5234 [Phytophthora cactorum]|nr:hypothetical protein GQ600_5234 [Phytophthora cactorum]